LFVVRWFPVSRQKTGLSKYTTGHQLTVQPFSVAVTVPPVTVPLVPVPLAETAQQTPQAQTPLSSVLHNVALCAIGTLVIVV